MSRVSSAPPVSSVPPVSAASPDGGADLTIDCDECTRRDRGECADCVVTFLLDRDPEDAVVIDAAEARALQLLEGAGLVPGLRFREAG